LSIDTLDKQFWIFNNIIDEVNFKKFRKESRKGDFKNFTKTNFQIFGDLNFEVSFDLKKFLFFK